MQLFNNEILSIICRRNFFRDIEDLRSILNPIKKAVVMLEHKNAILADCFICLAIIATSIKELPQVGTVNFRSQCETIFNKRWQEFNFDLYLLAYFLHPKYRGMVNII